MSVVGLSMIDTVVTWLAQRLSLLDVTMWGIQLLSTIPERALLFAICAIVMAGIIVAGRRARSARLRPLIPLVGALVLFRGLYLIFPTAHDADIVLVLVLVVIVVQLPAWTPEAGFGLSRWVVSIVILPGLAVGLLNGWSLQGLARALHRDPAVRHIAKLDLDSVAFDAENHLLYASGHGAPNLLAYDTDDLARPPHVSPVPVNNAQSFSYSAAHRELYVFNERDHSLLVLNAKTLDLKRAMAGVQMTEGDSRIVYDRYTDTLFVASEGGYWGLPTSDAGYPVAVVGRESGEIAYTLRDCGGLCIPGLIDIHPQKPITYLVFPKRIVAFNTLTRTLGDHPFQSDSWIDGMAFTPDGAELLVGAPLRAAVLRFDAESLRPKGSIRTVFGVRTLAVDTAHNLLLDASLATNKVDVIDLGTGARLATYYVGPWLRAIALDAARGRAYVSSTEGLFAVDYLSRVSAAASAARP